MTLPVASPLPPMLARLARELPRGAYFYEPKWDGFRALAFRDGESVEIQSRHGRPLARYFPEIVEALLALAPPRFVLDGEVVVTGSSGLDFPALMARLHPVGSRVERLRRETPAQLVAFDLLALGDEALLATPFEERRARLEAVVRNGSGVVLTPVTDDPNIAAAWLDSSSGGGVDGVVAKERGLTYQPGKRVMVKVKNERTADCVVAGFRWLAEDDLVSSLLLGLHDEDGGLRHVGVVTAFTRDERMRVTGEVAPLATTLVGHPWERGFGLERSPLGRLLGAAGRWIPDEMAMDWTPVRPELVCEVAYDHVDGQRFRHPARFRRWRPDRDPRSCALDQLEGGAPELPRLLAAR
ncbi:MAG: ATP-dependent DNA ligase [Actinomycetota bacterium]|nr:ATP-dependent DNA ligase [Actinomycetota bacterium]